MRRVSHQEDHRRTRCLLWYMDSPVSLLCLVPPSTSLDSAEALSVGSSRRGAVCQRRCF